MNPHPDNSDPSTANTPMYIPSTLVREYIFLCHTTSPPHHSYRQSTTHITPLLPCCATRHPLTHLPDHIRIYRNHSFIHTLSPSQLPSITSHYTLLYMDNPTSNSPQPQFSFTNGNMTPSYHTSQHAGNHRSNILSSCHTFTHFIYPQTHTADLASLGSFCFTREPIRLRSRTLRNTTTAITAPTSPRMGQWGVLFGEDRTFSDLTLADLCKQ